MNPLLNSQRPYISEEELKEEKRIYDAKYREDNQDGIKKYKNIKNKLKHIMQNITKIIKMELKNYLHQKHNCECGGKFTTNGKSQHYKTEKHTRKQTKII